jgi:pimeloyl-ACP methyl ester carboxylesterase
MVSKARPDLIKKLALMEGAFTGLLPKPAPASAKAGSSVGEIRKVAAARITQGDIDGGLELWLDHNQPGTWARRSDAWRQMSRDNAWTLLAPPEVSPVTCDDVAGLKMPVLLMRGEKTNPQMRNVVDATYKCLPSAERVTIPDAGHPMHLDNPAAFRVELVKFLSK